ncbi:hypothetical protein DNHGIG_25820 [Collibacillus ludicampi]|uniref:Uncharacterized protein n=1 Tax=Collibacillus ludicampi TaxID=2771369 RepID=A0AAV4LGY8_9BACL|nr:hypothetical protein [Collibacillus ludicampi]GIM47033.1 hypothetical protein DNHGIG_25820 [Collibacillus ludicampi]
MIDLWKQSQMQPITKSVETELLMNGPEPFFHPVTGKWVGPYEWYEGYAHVENEGTEEDSDSQEEDATNDETANEKRSRRTRKTVKDGE